MIAYFTNISFTCMHVTHQSELSHQLNGGCDFKTQINLQKEKIQFEKKKSLVRIWVIEDRIKRKKTLCMITTITNV